MLWLLPEMFAKGIATEKFLSSLGPAAQREQSSWGGGGIRP